MKEDVSLYYIPTKFRKTENLHILFWLIKDMSWAMLWKPLAMLMIVPTMAVAIVITYQNRKAITELYHNMAVVFWISANAYWMITEFFYPEPAFENLRYYSVIPFAIGLCIVVVYYLFIVPSEKRKRLSEQLELSNIAASTSQVA
jgi:hypothetical protein